MPGIQKALDDGGRYFHCAGHGHGSAHSVPRKTLSELENIIPYFTDDDFDLTKVIKLATEILFHLGADFQIITLP